MPSSCSMAWYVSVVIDDLWCTHASAITPLLLPRLTLHRDFTHLPAVRMCSACVQSPTGKMPRCVSPSFWSMAWYVSLVIDNLWCAHAVQFTPLLLYRFTVHPDTTHLPAVRMCSACVHPPTDKMPGCIAPSFYSMAWCRSVVIDNLWCALAVQITSLLVYWLTLHL